MEEVAPRSPAVIQAFVLVKSGCRDFYFTTPNAELLDEIDEITKLKMPVLPVSGWR